MDEDDEPETPEKRIEDQLMLVLSEPNDRSIFDQMTYAIDRLSMRDVKGMIEFYAPGRKPGDDTCQALALVGAARMVVPSQSSGGVQVTINTGFNLSYQQNEFGRRLVAILSRSD